MSQKFPANYPITGICIVSDPQKCPPGYDLLLKSHDKKDDCDLWRENSMFKRVTRYLCVTKAYPLNGQNNVIAGIQILNEKDMPPSGFSLVERTIDTSERASRKKQISIRLSNRDMTVEAISDVILLTKNRRPPEGYSLAGDINGVILCVKVGKVPVETQQFQHSSPISAVPAYAQRPAPPPPIAGYPNTNAGYQNNNNAYAYQTPAAASPSIIPARPATGTIKRADSTLAQNPLADVLFQLNPRHQRNIAGRNFQIPEVLYRSLVDIENEYNYSFTLEKSAIHRLPSTSD